MWCSATAATLWAVFDHTIRESFGQTYTSHVFVVPFAAAYLIWASRDRIFSAPAYSIKTAVQLSIAPVLMLLAARIFSRELPAFFLTLAVLVSFILLTVAGFVCFYGLHALKAARFPLALLALMLPVPNIAAEKVISFLQVGSTELTRLLFVSLGVPVLREGFILRVPGVSIEVARECSGINSTIALVITLLVVAQETLHTTWRKVVLLLLSIPLSIIKNAIRIVALTLLALHVDPSFLTGKLHHEGGVVFFLVALALMYPILRVLQTGEDGKRREKATHHSSDVVQAARAHNA